MKIFHKVFISTTAIITAFILYMRLYVVIPKWRNLQRMPNAYDGLMGGEKELFFNGITDEFVFVLAHFLIPLLYIIVISIFIKLRYDKSTRIWMGFMLFLFILEFSFRQTDAYRYIMAD